MALEDETVFFFFLRSDLSFYSRVDFNLELTDKFISIKYGGSFMSHFSYEASLL